MRERREEAGADVLLSEDLSSGKKVAGRKVKNRFVKKTFTEMR